MFTHQLEALTPNSFSVTPTPEILLGFETQKEQMEFLTELEKKHSGDATLKKLELKMMNGEIIWIRPPNPESAEEFMLWVKK